jgi:hypothetical protein
MVWGWILDVWVVTQAGVYGWGVKGVRVVRGQCGLGWGVVSVPTVWCLVRSMGVPGWSLWVSGGLWAVGLLGLGETAGSAHLGYYVPGIRWSYPYLSVVNWWGSWVSSGQGGRMGVHWGGGAVLG